MLLHNYKLGRINKDFLRLLVGKYSPVGFFCPWYLLGSFPNDGCFLGEGGFFAVVPDALET